MDQIRSKCSKYISMPKVESFVYINYDLYEIQFG